jgi:peptide/nickel transport system ATP-binding protein
MRDCVLDIKELEIQYVTEEGVVRAVNKIDLSIKRGSTMGLVGETGAGKTTTCLGILNLIAQTTGKIPSGEIFFNGEDLLKKTDREMQKIRGEQISMFFQDPMTALNPIMTVGKQIVENIRQHRKCAKKEAYDRMLGMLEKVGIPPERADDYPHQFSGGMKQRVVIAMALACKPSLLLADEPTSALDVTIQAQVLEMIKTLQEELNTAMLLITHDLGIVAEACSTVGIMYAGEIIEYGPVEDIFEHTGHPYTRGLFAAIPRLDTEFDRLLAISGIMPDPMDLPSGCKFHPRCPYADECCKEEQPALVELSPGHTVRCVKAGKLPERSGNSGIREV